MGGGGGSALYEGEQRQEREREREREQNKKGAGNDESIVSVVLAFAVPISCLVHHKICPNYGSRFMISMPIARVEQGPWDCSTYSQFPHATSGSPEQRTQPRALPGWVTLKQQKQALDESLLLGG